MVQFDALVKAARAEGVALFVEDIVPVTRVDEMGQVTLDWDAYDRLMQPYMDGTAFADGVPLPVWLAPVPRGASGIPARSSGSTSTCAQAFRGEKMGRRAGISSPGDWPGGFPAKRQGGGRPGEAVRAQVSDMMRLHMPRGNARRRLSGAQRSPRPVVDRQRRRPATPPRWTAGQRILRPRPGPGCASPAATNPAPAASAATAGSPTGVKGLVWRNAVEQRQRARLRRQWCRSLRRRSHRTPPLRDRKARPRAAAGGEPGRIMPTLRMTWLAAGLNDAALVDLLEHRANTGREGMVSDILAGMAGRTGLANDQPQILGSSTDWLSGLRTEGLPPAPTGFLYAGWPADKAIWSQVTPNLQKLILAADPETRGTLKPDDPAYLAAQLWLAGTRRAVARLAGYDFALRQGCAAAPFSICDSGCWSKIPSICRRTWTCDSAICPAILHWRPSLRHRPPPRRVSSSRHRSPLSPTRTPHCAGAVSRCPVPP